MHSRNIFLGINVERNGNNRIRAYIDFDDTDDHGSDFGTGKVARAFELFLPKGYHIWGVIRQQLLFDERIPYTSHNSSACVVVEYYDQSLRDSLIAKAVEHIERESAEGSDPGLCVACENDAALAGLTSFGFQCTTTVVTQREALQAAAGVHISGHGGSNDGIIGAAAAVGLTASGWSGRFIEMSGLRNFPEAVSIAEIERHGIRVMPLDRDATIPLPDDVVDTKGWLRPRLWGGKPVLPVFSRGKHLWESLGEKRKKKKR